MSSPIEQRLRDLFAAEADAAPLAGGLAQGAMRRVQRRRRLQLAAAGGVLGLALVVTGLSVLDGARPPEQSPVAASAGAVDAEATEERAPVSSDPAPGPVGALGGGTATSCVEAYSAAEAIAAADFAFDGTVTAIGPARSNRPGAELALSAVTFRVHTWFRGGSGDTVTVDLDTPLGPNASSEPSVPPYEIGTRLLVSGAPRWGGEPLNAAIAWGCGFTRPHDPQTAAEWAAATD